MQSTASAPRLETAKKSSWVLGGGIFVLCAAIAKLAIHLYASRFYGYFTDELYYLACARHLAWGYVDQPPLIAVIARCGFALFGDSLAAIRFFPALAGAGKVILTGLIARELGGRRFAQGLAALTVLLAPGFLGMDNLLSMNVFEPLFWLGCAYVYLRIVATGDHKLWLWFGVLSGLGLLNKHSMAIFAFGMLLGLALTRDRRYFRSPWLWGGGLICMLIVLPNLIWNIQHHFPFLELQANIRRDGRNVHLGPWTFFLQEMRAMLPLSLPIWFGGLWFYFFAKAGERYRTLGWTFLATFLAISFLNPRVYYVWPAFPLLMAGGAVYWEPLLMTQRLRWFRYCYPVLMIVMGVVFAPMLLPVLPPETYIRYAAALHLETPPIEKWQLGPLPQIYASEFGWEEMVATVALVYRSLPSEVRPKTAIFAQNFGQAGAIDLFGPRYGLPQAISGHQNYFLWGPGAYTGESVIVMQGRAEELKQFYATVEWRAHVSHPYSMPREHFDVFYCTGLKQPLTQVWPSVKNWH
ncbi:MAG TPA: glycosyltransferase family 39 protein [Terracidiphilus sp.]|jgi:4-amino-4-deoxy-L-arabinose transferase-like glycosyltransferase